MVGASEMQRLATSMEDQGSDATNHVATLDEFLWLRTAGGYAGRTRN